MTPTRRITSTDGTELAIYRSGADTGPIVVAIHGYPDNHSVWDGVADALAGYQVIRYDVRGAGSSGKPAGRQAYRIEQLLDDLLAVLDAEATDQPVHLLAHDWGSVQAWPALSDPRLDGRIASFTSISGPSLDHAAAWLRSAHRHLRSAARQVADSYYTMLFQLPGAPETAIRAGLFDRAIGPHDRDDELHGLNLYRANMLRSFARRRPQRISVPVQVLAPTRDPYITPELALEAPAPFVPDLRTRRLAGGHWVVRERPDVIARCVGELIDFVGGAPEPKSLARARRRRGSDPHAGRLVVITGGARGIGRATALEFARGGADIVIADVNDVAAKETERELAALGVDAAAFHLDVADADAWAEFADQVRAHHGVPDIVVNNAGIGMAGAFLDTTVDDWRRVLDVNLWGVLHGSRIFGRQLVDRGEGGHIVNVASAAAFSPSRTLPAYSTTKAAVLMASECLRAELAPHDIGVTAICPGFVDSDITRTTTYVGADDAMQQAKRDRAVAAYHRRNYPPERVARNIVRAVRRNTPVAAVSVEAKFLRELYRFAPPLARRLARVDLSEIGN
ncbi:MAG TPA: SDR family oxidoreductase [Jatrophihabitantaceae bacterium]